MRKLILITSNCLLIILFLLGMAVKAQLVENDFQSRTWLALSVKPLDKLKLSLSPELKFDKNFLIDEFLLEAEADYKLFSFLSIGTAYRFIGNNRKTKETEYLHRYEFNAAFKKDIKRYSAACKVSYTNYADDQFSNQFLRYKASLEYDIPKSKISPFAGVEIFQQLKKSKLYKTRYFIGMEYKLYKKNYLQISYKFDYYLLKYKNRHILDLGYKIKL